MLKLAKIVKFIIFFSALLCYPSFIKADIPEINKYEDKVLKNFYAGDNYKLYNSIEKLIINNYSHPVSTLYYKDLINLIDIYGPERAEKTFNYVMVKIRSDKSIKNKNARLLLLKLIIENLLYKTNFKKAKKITNELNPVRKWTIIGPYNKYGYGDINYPFLPEIITKFKGSEINKKKLQLKNYSGTLETGKFLFPNHGVIYAIASFNVKEPVKVRIYSKSFYKVSINGREVLKNLKENFRNLRIIEVSETKKISLMIKLYVNSSSKLRVLLTDRNDRIVKYRSIYDSHYTDEFKSSEIYEYPYKYLINEYKKDPIHSSLQLGIYFNDLDSGLCIKYYTEAANLSNSPVIKFLASSAMIEMSKRDTGSALYLKGWEIIDNLYNEHPDFIPAAYKRLTRLISGRNFIKAYRSGRRLFFTAPKNLQVNITFLHFLNSLGYEKEFLKSVEISKKYFPNSIYPLFEEAKFYRSRNRNKFRAIALNILNKEFSKEILKLIITELKSRGEYNKAVELIKRYNFNRDFTEDLIMLNIKKGRYKTAKNLLFKEIINKDKPSLYYMLGMVDYSKNADPLMYWMKMLSLNPSIFSHSDYIAYLENKRITYPLNEYYKPLKKTDFPAIPDEYKKYPSTVLHRARIFRLNKDGSSRVLCDDLIYINNQRGIDSWGDSKIPFSGKIHPIQIRVYQSNGNYTDSYRIQKIDRDKYININSIKRNSILHLTYIVDNPIKTPVKSNLFSLPFKYIQNYDEPVKRLIIKVIAPDNMNINFHFKNSMKIKKDILNKKNIYSINMKNIIPVHKERYSGDNKNSLQYFSFSNMNNMNDFITWYNGLVSGKISIKNSPELNSLKGKSTLETIGNVYNHISSEINLQKNILYYPEKAEDVFYRKKGTVEDKVILAKAILNNFGIKSYISFAKKKYLPDYREFISHNIFTHILLYIPININKGLWLDFSNKYFSSGTTDHSIQGTNALILLKNNYEIKTVLSKKQGLKISKYLIKIDSRGNGECSAEVKFHGPYNKIKRHFTNRLFHENIINLYSGSILPTISINNYKIKNLKSYNKPFIISFNGSSIGTALIGVNKIILQPILNKSKFYKYIQYLKRKQPLVIHSPIKEKEEYIYLLPGSFNTQEIKKSYHLKSKFGYARFHITKAKNSNRLKVTKVLDFKSVKVKPEEYKEFLKFCLNLKKIEYKNLVIK